MDKTSSYTTVRLSTSQHRQLKMQAVRAGISLSDRLGEVVAEGLSAKPRGCCFAGVAQACPIHEKKP